MRSVGTCGRHYKKWKVENGKWKVFTKRNISLLGGKKEFLNEQNESLEIQEVEVSLRA